MPKTKTVRVAAGEVEGLESEKPPRKLTWAQSRFIYAYIQNGGNGAAAARDAGYSALVAKQIASENLTKPYLLEAITQEKERLAKKAAFSRDEAILMLVEMARVSMDDLIDVLKDPDNQENYAALGEKRFAIKKVSSSPKNGNSVELYDRQSIINDLWEKLGLGSSGGKGNWFDGLDRLAEFVRGVKEKK